jgi:hypothetical protein
MQAMTSLSWSPAVVTYLPHRLTFARDSSASDAANPLPRGMTPTHSCPLKGVWQQTYWRPIEPRTQSSAMAAQMSS